MDDIDYWLDHPGIAGPFSDTEVFFVDAEDDCYQFSPYITMLGLHSDDEEMVTCADDFIEPRGEKRICICSFAADSNTWRETFLGTSWIAVNGISAVCAVAKDPNQDVSTRPICRLDSTEMLQSAAADMKDESSAIYQRMMDHCSKTGSMTGPFAVVSLGQDVCQIDLERNIRDAINFLTEKLKGRPSLTPDETVQIAFCALKHLFGSTFKSSEIKLWCSGEHYNGTISARKVEEHLDAMNQTTTTTKDLPASFSALCALN